MYVYMFVCMKLDKYAYPVWLTNIIRLKICIIYERKAEAAVLYIRLEQVTKQKLLDWVA